ncbi:MAG: hypothetical protein AB7K08_14400, partial [Microbacteriaceae bacterium]
MQIDLNVAVADPDRGPSTEPGASDRGDRPGQTARSRAVAGGDGGRFVTEHEYAGSVECGLVNRYPADSRRVDPVADVADDEVLTPHESCHGERGRSVKEPIDGVVLKQLTGVDDRDPVGDSGGFVAIVGDHEHRGG